MKGTAFIFGAAGAIIGATASYFITKKICQKEAEQQYNDIRAMYEERIGKIMTQKITVESDEEKKAEMMRQLEEKVEAEKASEQNTDYVDYTSNFKKSVNAQEEELFKGIKFITEAEAQKYSKEYELLGLTLYEDDVLIDDETENIIDGSEIEYWIGAGNIPEIRSKCEDAPVYILNTMKKAVFDITVMGEKFGQDEYEPVTIH